ncbi:molybdopterin-dependent oxidoreductase [Enhygromyxa salina]|uniref:Sulfoxide reductase catalytic subunit YedY n=1 Tax=Enhygromyxa salina TaxID=215803 RepID=A0A2S9Y4F6_9BACT|nr:molybdopterin-dependent oxidoreductase [Enhygromyxa salina]PRP99955.1 Sulfoxide reductase catalytic subunit YedY precursor [Enhygromyxa salina]
MPAHARRQFLYLCAGGATTLLFACSEELGGSTGETGETGETDDGNGGPCADPFAGGVLLGAITSFEGEGQTSVGDPQGQGLDGRLALDLGTLEADTLITQNDDFFVRTALPDQLDLDQAWNLRVSGLVDAELDLSLDDLAALPQTSRVVLLECSGNGDNRAFGLISAAEWSGVLLTEILAMVSIQAQATAVLIEGFDQHSQPSTSSSPGCSWVFRFDELAAAGAMLATHMNGEPLPPDHGQPLRLIIPGWYGCCNAKWVDSIRLVGAREPATAQMLEFATRTHQTQAHALAADYAPAIMQQAAMPVRVERWSVDGALLYKIVGIMWGGTQVTDALAIRFDGGAPLPVQVCPTHASTDTWTLWSYAWKPGAVGTYEITMAIDDPTVSTVRLDSGYYARRIVIDEV